MLRRTELTRKSPMHSKQVKEKKVNPKRCKAKGCFEHYTPDLSKPWVSWCSEDCAVQIGLDRVAKSKQAAAKKERAADREKLERLKTRSDYIKEAQVAFNAFIRERDKDQPCICCGKHPVMESITGGSWDCGHYRSVGSAPHLRFNEDNAHRQRKMCNRDLAGNAVAYRIGLIRRIGIERVEALESDNSPAKWTIQELIEIRDKYRSKLKELRNARSD
jgi:hypothetical protein